MQQHPILSTLLLPKSESSKLQQTASALQTKVSFNLVSFSLRHNYNEESLVIFLKKNNKF